MGDLGVITMGKLVTCKMCREKIAKTAKVCPKCGAKQHQGALAACVVICLIAVFAIVAVVASSLNGTSAPDTTSNSNYPGDAVVFNGANAQVSYLDVFDTAGVSGCIYVQLQIDNIGDAECVYNLSDAYVNNFACNTGTGLPVVAAAGKSVNGSFIIFTDVQLDDISSLAFKVEARDNSTFSLLESSDTITITP